MARPAGTFSSSQSLPLSAVASLMIGAAAVGGLALPIVPQRVHYEAREPFGFFLVGDVTARDEMYVQETLLDVEETIERLFVESSVHDVEVLTDYAVSAYGANEPWEVVSRRIVETDVGQVGRYLEEHFEVWA